jgi:hypothetical protein
MIRPPGQYVHCPKERMNPIDSPHQVGRQINRRFVPTSINVLAHLIYEERLRMRRRLMSYSSDLYRTITELARARVDFIDCQPLKFADEIWR